MDDIALLGAKIRDIRVRRGISQSRLAKKLGFQSHTAISDIERGKTSISVDQLQKIARAFNLSFQEILNHTLPNMTRSNFRDDKDISREEQSEVDQSLQGFLSKFEELRKKDKIN